MVFAEDTGILPARAPLQHVTLQVVDRRDGVPIAHVSGITLQRELDQAREGFQSDLEKLTTKEFIDKYTGKGPDWKNTTRHYRVDACRDCHRPFADTECLTRSELKRTRCPACDHEVRRRHFVGLLRGSFNVLVPDQYFQARSAQSFVDHGWIISGNLSGVVSIHRHRFEVATITIAPGIWVQLHS